MKEEKKLEKKVYQQPKIKNLGNMVQVTLPGGSKGAEGGSGKGDTFG